MMIATGSAAACAAAPSLTPASAAIVQAAHLLLPHLERGRRIDSDILRTAMETGFGGSDAESAWDWKTAYDACEGAEVLFLRRFGPAMRARAGSPAALLSMLAKIAALLPSHTRRSEESQALQQFSTPITLGFVAATAAAITTHDVVLEPSAGTGLLAVFAELAAARPVLNELANARADLLTELFSGIPVTRHDAAHIHDHLDPAVRPTVVLMNPPFSVAAHVDGRVSDAALRHISSALARLADGGRVVAITGANLSPDNPSWRDAFAALQERGRVVFTAAIDGRVYARHGTNTDTRLTVIDRVAADDPAAFPPSPGMASDTAMLLDWVSRLVPPRAAVAPVGVSGRVFAPVTVRTPLPRPAPRGSGDVVPIVPLEPTGTELIFEVIDWTPGEAGRITDTLYEPYTLQSICISGSKPHPTRLVQSAAMASVAPPKPSYRPHLPANLVSDGLLSDAQRHHRP
jgi:predicted RNA methylase